MPGVPHPSIPTLIHPSRPGLRGPIYPTKAVKVSPRSGVTQAEADRATGQIHSVPKSPAEEFRQSIRIDIGGLEMRAHEGKGARFEAARQFCALQYSLVASTTASAEDKLAALDEIDAAVNKLDAQFPGVFTAAKDLVVSAREGLSASGAIEGLKSELGAGGGGAGSSNSSASASDIASLRAAESTKVTLPPLRIHAPSASQHLPIPALNLGPTLANIDATDKLLKNLWAIGASDLGNRLLLGEVADFIDEIVRGGNAAQVVLAVLKHGLGELHLTHKDPEMRAELDRVLSYCFDQRGDERAFAGETRLEKRVEFLLREAPRMAPGLNKCRDDFAHKLVDDIRRETGEDSNLMLYLLCELDRLPGLDQLKQAIHQQAADGSD